MEEQPAIFCWKCGTQNHFNTWRCIRCGEEIHLAQPPAASDDGLVERVIPYRNALALFAYYIGVFAAIPCIGMLLGPVAFFMGIFGLRYARKHPEAHGHVHAWLGIVLGGIFTVLYWGMVIYFILEAR